MLFSKNKKLCPFPAIIATITDWQGNFEALQLKDSLAYWTLNGGILKTISQSFTWKRSFWSLCHNHVELSFRSRMHTFSQDGGSIRIEQFLSLYIKGSGSSKLEKKILHFYRKSVFSIFLIYAIWPLFHQHMSCLCWFQLHQNEEKSFAKGRFCIFLM